MVKKRVDIKLEEEVLRWAAIEAAKIGISRRQYLSKLITKEYLRETTGIKFMSIGDVNIGYTPTEAYNETKPE
jgi:hypothetical protein